MTKQKKQTKSSFPTITVKQVGSPIGRETSQRKTLIGLGLNKIGRVSKLESSPSVLGMIRKVSHLVTMEEL